NLSSIIVLATLAGKSMLLTGDARGDEVIHGLEQAGLKKHGQPFHVDLLKIPHHGSQRNVAPEFFQQVTADHYVISSDGEKFSNPDIPTLRWLSEARANDAYTLYLTYPEEEFDPMFDRKGFDQLRAEEKQAGRKHRIV